MAVASGSPARMRSRTAGVERRVHAAGHDPGWMHALLGQPLDHLLAELAQRDAVARQSRDASRCTPKTLRCAGSESKPSSRSGAERWKKLSACDCTNCAQCSSSRSLTRGLGDAHRHDGVAGLGRGQQVADRADAADARGDGRHLVVRAALGELLEAAHLRDVELRAGDLAVVVQMDGDLGVALRCG